MFGRDASADAVVQHYPKLRKYVSLFPPETEGESEQSETDAVREEVRSQIRDRMKKGEISVEAEEGLA